MLPTFSVVQVRDESGALLSSVTVDGKGGGGGGGGGGLLLGHQDKQDKKNGKAGGKGGAREAELISAADTLPLNSALQSKVAYTLLYTRIQSFV